MREASKQKAVLWSPGARYERLESNIGEGTYGKIHKCMDLQTSEIVAIKKAKITNANRATCGIAFTIIREIKLMQAVEHENVMGLLNAFNDGGVLHLVMAFMDSDLRKVIDDRTLELSESHVKCLFCQVARGTAALHKLFFVHRDIAPTNILLSYRTGVAKISDFGSARTYGNDQRPMTPNCTTLWYRSPELLYGARFYGQPVDIWSLGCILGELFLRGTLSSVAQSTALFPGRGELDMLEKVFEKRGTPNPDVWQDCNTLPRYMEFSQHAKTPVASYLQGASEAAADLVDLMLTLDPKQRPTAAELLEHEFCTVASPPACDRSGLPFVERA